MKRRLVDYGSHESPYRPIIKYMEWERSVDLKGEKYSPDLANALRSLRVDIKRYKENNYKFIET